MFSHHFTIDKTGTLTRNHLRLEGFVSETIQFESLHIINRHLMLQNPDHSFRKILWTWLLSVNYFQRDVNELCLDPLDKAVLHSVTKMGFLTVVKQFESEMKNLVYVGQVLFDAKHKFATVSYKMGNMFLTVFRGAPELLLNASGTYLSGSSEKVMNSDKKNEFLAVMNEMASGGYRILSVAWAKVVDISNPNEMLENHQLCFCGVRIL
jgi:magnesium-transporting ATPase (P-type)